MGQIIAPGANSATTGPFGSSIGSRFFRTHGVPVIRGGNLSTDVGIRLRDIDLVFVSKEKATEFRRSTVRNGDLVFTCWGTINQIGLIDDSAAYPEYVISNKQMKLTPDHTRVLSEFLYFLFSGPAMQREILSGAIGSSIPGFNLGRLRSLKLLLPPLEEQQAIVRTLVDADNLSKSLERLITKKSAIRQSMTQQLLTGRARLPGFSGSWVSLHVAECSMLKARIGWQGLSKSEYKSGGIFRLIGGTELLNGRVAWDAAPFVNKWRYDQDQGIQVCCGDVLLTKDGTIGKTAYVEELPGPATLNSGVFVIRPYREAYDSQFLYYMLRSRAFADFLARLTAGSTISHLYQRDLSGLVLKVPPTIAEQKAIARSLARADRDLDVLRALLRKANSIKQGMMQELLTGRTRLPAMEEATT